MTTTQTTAVAEAKERITDAILNGANHGHFIDLCVRGKWNVAEMHVGGLNAAGFEEVKAHTLAELAKYRTTLDKPMDAAAAAACRRLMGSMPYSGMSSLKNARKFVANYHGDPPALTLGDFVAALEEVRDQVNAGLEAHREEATAFNSLQRDVAAFRRVLGIETTPSA